MNQLSTSKLQITHSVMNNASINKARGIVLPSVLWITVLTIIVAANYASDVRTNTKTLNNIKTALHLKYDAMSGVFIALQRLLSESSNKTSRYSAWVNDSRVDIKIQQEDRKTSLNVAAMRELRTTFINMGVDRQTSDVLSARVIDWRDPDHSTHAFGMEDHEYAAAGKKYGAKDERFDDLVELRLIDGVTDNVASRVSDYFTVYGKGSGKLFSINSVANNTEGDKSFVINAIVQLTNQSNRPYRVLKWKYNQS